MRFVVVTGMSGSGKTQALKMLEDMGYFCVDNLPLALIGKFAELAAAPAQEYSKVALGLDVRSLYKGKGSVDRFLEIMKDYPHEILFLDCSQDGISAERQYLMPLRDAADYVLDTSDLLTRQLMGELQRLFEGDAKENSLLLSILSFGYKYGIPSDADLVFDVRFLPNPFYVDELRHKTGEDPEVQAYVCQGGEADVFQEKVMDLLAYLIPKYSQEGKRQLMICVGCTGGKHRSVTMANRLADAFANSSWPVSVLHRDIAR